MEFHKAKARDPECEYRILKTSAPPFTVQQLDTIRNLESQFSKYNLTDHVVSGEKKKKSCYHSGKNSKKYLSTF
jgi:hypothetical protein